MERKFIVLWEGYSDDAGCQVLRVVEGTDRMIAVDGVNPLAFKRVSNHEYPDHRHITPMSTTTMRRITGLSASSEIKIDTKGKITSRFVSVNLSGICIASYDIETVYDKSSSSGFEDPDVICATWVCSCGKYATFNTVSRLCEGYVDTSSKCCELLISTLLAHKPVFTIAHNGYMFDNTRIAYWMIRTGNKVSKYFKRVTVPSTFKRQPPSDGYIIEYPGSYNLDSYIYIRKYYYGKFSKFGLDDICISLGIKGKSEKPSFSRHITYTQCVQMIEYNKQDCRATLNMILHKDINAIPRIYATLNECACEFSDISLGHQGNQSLCIVNKYSVIHGGILMNWPFDVNSRERYSGFTKVTGGNVIYIRPCTAYYSCAIDFASLYPSIMMCGVSPNNISLLTSSLDDCGLYDWTRSTISTNISGTLCTFRRNQGIFGEICSRLIKERKQVGKYSVLGNAKKIQTNSVYGISSAPTIPSFSPYTASSVTSIGRWSQTACSLMCAMVGHNSCIYGDTDSVMFTCTHMKFYIIDYLTKPINVRECVGKEKSQIIMGYVVRSCNLLMEFCGLDHLKMEPDGVFKFMTVLKPKMYVGVNVKGKAKYKGVSIVRRDGSRHKNKVYIRWVDDMSKGMISGLASFCMWCRSYLQSCDIKRSFSKMDKREFNDYTAVMRQLLSSVGLSLYDISSGRNLDALISKARNYTVSWSRGT